MKRWTRFAFSAIVSSGRMGFSVAAALVEAGADATLIAGPVQLQTPPGVERIDVETAAQMMTAVHERIAGTDGFCRGGCGGRLSAGSSVDSKDQKV